MTTLQQYTPRANLLNTLSNDLSGLWDDFDLSHIMLSRLMPWSTSAMGAPGWLEEPTVHLSEQGDHYTLAIDVPGVQEKDIDITLEQNVMTLRARRETSIPEGFKIHRQERASLETIRSFTLPANVDPDQVHAKLENGVLKLTLKKEKQAAPKKITLSA